MNPHLATTAVAIALLAGCNNDLVEPSFTPLERGPSNPALADHGNLRFDTEVRHRLDQRAGTTAQQIAQMPAQPDLTFGPRDFSTGLRQSNVAFALRQVRLSDDTIRAWTDRLQVRSWPEGRETAGALRCVDRIEGSGDDMLRCQYVFDQEPPSGWYTATLEVPEGVEVPDGLRSSLGEGHAGELVTHFYQGSRPIVREVVVAQQPRLALRIDLTERVELGSDWWRAIEVRGDDSVLACEDAGTDRSQPSQELLLECEGQANSLTIIFRPGLETIEGTALSNPDGSSPARLTVDLATLQEDATGLRHWRQQLAH